MKNKLFYILLLASTLNYSQILQEENFNSLNVATVVGQSSPVYEKLNGVNADYMVTTNGNSSTNGLSITGAATTGTGTSRYLWKAGLDAAWASRTAGNEIIQVEYDFFTGPTSTSNNGGGMELYDSTYNIYLGGLTMLHSTKVIYGFKTVGGTVSLTNVGTGATPAAVTLPANTWVRVGFAFNTSNGNITYKGPGFYTTITGNDIAVPFEVDYAVQNLSATNTANSINLFDNVTVKAVATESLLLSTTEVDSNILNLTVYPNPTTDFLQISVDAKILEAFVYDLSGIRTKVEVINNRINTKDFIPGTYILGLKTSKSYQSAKFIKK